MTTELPENVVLTTLDDAINWGRTHSTWPMFFGLSCCFVEMTTALTPTYDLARFGAEVIRGTPRQADLMVISGTPFKKMGPAILRVYEQLANPKWVISMGSCANSGGMYDCYSVIQGIDQLLPVDLYIPGCPPRPEAFLEGLLQLQAKIRSGERPARPVLGLDGGSEGTSTPVRQAGIDKSRDPRGPGFGSSPIRGTSQQEPAFFAARSPLIWTPPQPRIPVSPGSDELRRAVAERFGDRVRRDPESVDMPTLLVTVDDYLALLDFLKNSAPRRYRRLESLTALDERARSRRPSHDFTLVCHLLSFEGPDYLRVKLPLAGAYPECPSLTALWPAANWYEREVYDLFGIVFTGHPRLERLLLPQSWEGHPLRKEYPGRGTQMAPYTAAVAETMLPPDGESFFAVRPDDHRLCLNIGPTHPGTHGVLRAILKLDGEAIDEMALEIGYHHRAAEKIAERQHWAQFLPYTDRIDYLAGVLNNLAYLHSLETMLGIAVPPRAAAIRVLLCELSRIASHLVWYGTFGADVGAMTPVFYAFVAREEILGIIELITGGRMHPAWLRIGGVAADLPAGWQGAVNKFIANFPAQLAELEKLLTDNPIFRARTEGVGVISPDEALDWGLSGPVLRATGIDWDLRRKLPYGGYEQYDFGVALASGGDCFARYQVRMQEMRESLAIVRQIVAALPTGPWVSADHRFVRPPRERMLHDIESLIDHFVNVSRGPSIAHGECYRAIESSKGEYGYYLVSDGLSTPYRLHIRTPSFANIQMVPQLCRGGLVSDLMAILGSMDYVLADIDR